METGAQVQGGMAGSSFAAWLRMRAPVAAKAWSMPDHRDDAGQHRDALGILLDAALEDGFPASDPVSVSILDRAPIAPSRRRRVAVRPRERPRSLWDSYAELPGSACPPRRDGAIWCPRHLLGRYPDMSPKPASATACAQI